MDWDDVRHFLALARTGSVRAAGASLGVSHSTVARRVESLETRLGAKLFDRHRDGYLLTEAGHAMVVGAEQVEREMAALERGLAGQDARLDGLVRVTCTDPFIAKILLRFDSAWAYSILHLVPDRPRALAALFALLKPRGTLISSNVCLGESWVPYGPLITLMRWFGKAPFVHIYDRETILRELREAGFVSIEEKDVGADRTVAFIVANKPA